MDNQVIACTCSENSNEDIKSWPDMAQIIDTVMDVCLGKKDKEQAIKELLLQYKDVAVLRIENKARQKIDDLLRSSDFDGVRELSETEFSDRLIQSSKGIGQKVILFCKREISLQELVDTLSDTGIYEIAKDALEAIGIPKLLKVESVDAIWQMSANAVGYASMTALFQELMQALEDEQLAHERRILMEKECAESVASITRYRTEMERVVSDYLQERYEAFEKGFAAMDQAVLDNDVNGYIRGNVMIQKVLGYHVRFTTQEEFNDLMMSEEAFKF